MSDWIQTYTGRKFYPLEPSAEDVDIRDIAHALSLTCRFGGHCKHFHSVAHHCLLVVYEITSNNIKAGRSEVSDCGLLLWALLHDAAEAYLCDLPTPVKHDPAFNQFRDAEKRIMRAICQRFGLPEEEPAEVKEIDKKIFGIEAWQLFPSEMVKQWKHVGPSTGQRFNPLTSQQAETAYLAIFRSLTKKEADLH